MKRLHNILSYRRAHGSLGEAAMFLEVIAPYKPTMFHHPKDDVVFAYVIDVADKHSVVPPVLWCCHIDTVHSIQNADVRQLIHYDPDISLFWKEDKYPLGADDGAGVWLLLNMIDAKVPGTYIFHRGEERGGIGSQGMAAHHKEWLSRFKWAIAFDRRGTSDIITEQMAGVCASDTFATTLAAALNEQNKTFDYKPDPTGSFTDTSNYRKIIPECTNVSVGYENEHTGQELLDVDHLMALKDAVIGAFAGGIDLPALRDKDAPDVNRWLDFEYDGVFGASNYVVNDSKKGRNNRKKKYKAPVVTYPDLRTAADVIDVDFTEIMDYVENADSYESADLIYTLAQQVQELEEALNENKDEANDALAA